MGVSQATSGFGVLFKAGNGSSSETFTTIAEVKSISGPALSLEIIDVTHMESPSLYREKLPSFKDAGEVTLEVNFLPGHATQQAVITDFEARTKRNFQIIWTDSGATAWEFSGYYTGFAPSAGIDDAMTATITITVTGGITIS